MNFPDAQAKVELVIFDLAGTTVKDNGQVPSAFTAALAQYDINVTPEQLSAVRGSSKRQAVVELLPDGPERVNLAQEVYASFRERLSESYRQQGIEAIDGAEEIFGWLRSKDVRIALNTGFDQDITDQILATLKWNERVVDAVVCGDQVPLGRPAPYLIFRAMEATGITSVHTVANVGDTELDLRSGHNAGVRWNIGVLSGAHDRQKLENAPHTHLLTSVTGLFDLWANC